MPMIDGKARILSNKWINEHYKHLIIDTGVAAAYTSPGQFFNLLCPQIGQEQLFFRRPFSVYSADERRGWVEFLYKVVGPGTRGLSQLTHSDQVQFFGPLGHGFSLAEHWQHILIIGRGSGLAALAPLANIAANQKLMITAILSAKDPQYLITQQRFLHAGATVIEVVDSNRSSDIKNVEQLIIHIHRDQPIDAFFTCGSKRLAKCLQQLSQRFSIAGQVALEQPLECGSGSCQGCIRPLVIDGRLSSQRICYDGPVFDIQKVAL